MFDGLDDELEGLEEVEVVEGAGQSSGLVLCQAIKVTLEHREAPQHLWFGESVRLFYYDRHHDVD
jgi:hypothetical protein